MRFFRLWITRFCIFVFIHTKCLSYAIFHIKSYPHPSVDNLVFLQKYAVFLPAENLREFLQNLTGNFHGFYKKTHAYFPENMHEITVPFFDTSYLPAGFQYDTLFIQVFGV